METVEVERRRSRSIQLNGALRLLFENTARRAGLSHLVLADGSGLMHAGIGEHGDCESLAAYAPMLERVAEPAARRQVFDAMAAAVPGLSRETMTIRRLEIAGETLFVCAIGAPGSMKDIAVTHAMAGARRILA
jgi:hypothetical protein